jgi:hypothetical protein
MSVSNGLLGNVTADSDDKLPEVVQTVAGAFSSGLRGEARLTESGAGTDSFSFDPFAAPSQNVMQHEIKVRPLDDPALFDRVRRGVRDRQSCVAASVCVPLMTTVEVTVIAPGGAVVVSALLPVPDPTRSLGIRLNRSACGKVENTLTIEDGLLTKYDVTHPSEVADCLSIPLDVIAAVISAPVDAITGRKARIAAEKDLIAAQILLAQKQSELAELQASAGSTDDQ